ncbi:MAG: HEAT repeat domain-containing protein [Candidatus Aminicenantes bacterium]
MSRLKTPPPEKPSLRHIKKRLSSAAPEDRAAIIRESAGSASTQSLLWDLLEDPDDKIRSLAVKELSGCGRLNPAEITKKLSHPQWFIKCAALDIIGKMKDPDYLENLTPLIQDRNAEVRKTTARILGEIGGRNAEKLLIPLLRDKSLFVKTEAEKSIAKISRLKFT